MKFFIVFLLSSSLYLTFAAQWTENYNQVFIQAKAENKSVLIMLSQENCKACWYMENIVFEDVSLRTKLEKLYLFLYLDVHKDNLHGLTFSGTPTIYFVDKQENVMKGIEGVYNIKEFTAVIDSMNKKR